MSKEKFEVSKKEGEHFKLSQLEGEWVESFGMGTGIMFSEGPSRLSILEKNNG